MAEPAIHLDYSQWALARLREGIALDDVDAARLDAPALEYLGVCRALNGGERRKAFDNWTRLHPKGKDIVARVFAVPQELTAYPEPDASTNAPDKAVVYVDLPDLPHDARLTGKMESTASDTGEFIQRWQAYIAALVNTIPADFTEAGALCIWSIAVARRAYVATYFEPQVFPNLWCLLVAESTVFHKTTALNAHRRFIRSAMAHMLLPEEASGDRLIQEMAGIDPVNYAQMRMYDQERWRQSKQHAGQRGIVIDEASALFSGFRKDYNIGKIETFLKAYDCDEEKIFSTIRHGNINLRYLYMPLLGATTPAAIQNAANLQMWEMGFWPRFTVLVPERLFPDPLIPSDELIPRPAALDQALQSFLERLPKPESAGVFQEEARPPESLNVAYTADVWKHWTKFDHAMSYTLQHPDTTPDSRLRKVYGRLPVKLLQVATLLACMDWRTSREPKIELCHYARAHQIVERWRVNAHRFVEVMSRPLQGEDRERRVLNTITRITAAGELATTREIYRHTGWPREQIELLLLQMQRDGLIEAEKSDSKRTEVWKVVKG